MRNVLLDLKISPKPHDFIPERWLSASGFCPSFARKQALCRHEVSRLCTCYHEKKRLLLMTVGSFAMAELYIIIACIFRRFVLELRNIIRERGIDMMRECRVGAPLRESPGPRVKVVAVYELRKDWCLE